MPTDVIMPALGASQDTGTLLSWLKQEGDAVASGEPLMLVETDKTTVELDAPASGTLAAVSAAEGDEVVVGTVIALILGAGESLPEPAGPGGGDGPPATPPAPDVTAPAPTGGSSAPAPQRGGGDERVSAAATGRVPASPKVRRLAEERGIDLATVRGSGPDGAILAADLDATPDAGEGAGGAAGLDGLPAGDRRDTSVWRAMASNVTRSWQAVPHFYLLREISAAGLSAARDRAGRPTTYTDLLVAVLARTLRDHPALLAAPASEGIGIGVAVGTPDGLFVPVVHGADRLELGAVTERRRDLVDRVRTGRHTVTDVTGATFTLSNLGMYGVDSFQAIVTDGQTGILAVGRIVERVVARDGNFAIAPVVSLSLSCDHRLVDGLRAAEFLSDLAERLEDADALSDLTGSQVAL